VNHITRRGTHKMKLGKRVNLKRQPLDMYKVTLHTRRRQIIRRLIQIIGVIGLIGTLVIGLYLWHAGLLTDQMLLRHMIERFGLLGPIVFIGVQIIQVVLPIIPGGITLAVGPLLFGPWLGFIYNYVGIVIGSLLLFQIGRTFGIPLVETLVPRKIYRKYIDKLNGKRWVNLFIIMMVLPIAPDDALILLTSLTKMPFKQFCWILVLSKPIGIACYSFVLLYGFDWLLKIFGM